MALTAGVIEMGILSWIVMGLLVGALAKWIMPGPDGGGLIVTMLLGIVGAFVGGWIGSLLGFSPSAGFNIASIGLATAGALLVLFVYKKIKS